MKKFLRTAAVMVMAAALLGGCASTDSTAENNAETTEAEGTEAEGTDAEAEAAEAGAALSVVVEPMTEDEFAQLDPGSVENPVIDNFSKVTITVDMTGMIPGTERNVKMPALRNLMADTGIGTYIQGSGSSENDTEADFSKFVSENIIYREGLTDEDIKGIFAGAEAVATYVDANGETVETTIPFADYIEFK